MSQKAPIRRETSTNYGRPFRPAPIKLANRLGQIFIDWGITGLPLTVDDLMESARRKTGLSNFGDERFREPLGRLLLAIETEAQLNPIGHAITRNRIIGVLSNRLRVFDLLERRPEIREREIKAPIVIAGLQRTGTTMLHRLLSEDRGLRSLMSWEALNPVPLPWRVWDTRDPRIRQAELAQKGLAYMAPDFFAVHPIDAQAPEEEVLLLDYSFLSTVPEATLRVPSFSRWLENEDQTPAYETLKLLLQVLDWQRPGERWVLKTPHHLEWLDELFAVFPDAKVIHTHRDPRKTVGSFCSMIAHGRGVFSDRVDAREVGDDWSRKTARLISRALDARSHLPESSFVDVSYYDLMRDPIAEVERIYAAVDRTFSPETKERMQRSLRSNKKDRHGKHRYRLADFGLDSDKVEALFGHYRERFDIPVE